MDERSTRDRHHNRQKGKQPPPPLSLPGSLVNMVYLVAVGPPIRRAVARLFRYTRVYG
jgi:hypothetical protein